MARPEAGIYLLTNVGFSYEEKSVLTLQQNGEFNDFEPLGQTLTLAFDTSTRFCVGWRDIRTGKRSPCPDGHTIDNKFEQCAACQKRTGFNPAFYHATSVSTQQEERNAQPHILYLAHFAPGIMKVGISYAARGRSRLLEQGARSAVILDTFPTAHIARQYEAKIAKQPGIAETIQLRKKIQTFEQPYDHSAAAHELQRTRRSLETALGTSFIGGEIMTFDDIYFPNGLPDLISAHEMSNDNLITGKVMGELGSLLFCRYEDTPLFLPLKKYTGYNVRLSYDQASVSLPARQTSLF